MNLSTRVRFSAVKYFAQNFKLKNKSIKCVTFCREYSTKRIDLCGIFPPIATPFDENEQVSYAHLKANLDKWEQIPFRGYVVLGSTGEFVSMTQDERVSLVQCVKNTISPKKYIIAGSGCESTLGTIDQTKRMADVGADAVLVVSPCFYKGRMTDEALFCHYSKVADASPIPVILYSVPANTSIDLNASLVCKLADHPNIIGMKDSGGDVSKIGYMVHKTKGKDFQIVAGSAGFLYSALCLGCVGGVVALGNVLGGPSCNLHQLFFEGKHDEARDLQHKLIGPNLCVTKRFGIPGVKKAMDLLGLYGGPCRSPLLPLEKKDTESLLVEFMENGFI